MINIKILHSDNKLKLSIDKKKGYRPKMGFYRDRHGNFVKKFGDPRCISEGLKLKQDKEDQETKERAAKRQQEEKHSKPIAPQNVWGGNSYTIIYHPRKYEIDDILACFTGVIQIQENQKLLIVSPARSKPTTITDIDRYEKFSYIQIDEKENQVRFWLNSGFEVKPDIIVDGCIVTHPESKIIQQTEIATDGGCIGVK